MEIYTEIACVTLTVGFICTVAGSTEHAQMVNTLGRWWRALALRMFLNCISRHAHALCSIVAHRGRCGSGASGVPGFAVTALRANVESYVCNPVSGLIVSHKQKSIHAVCLHGQCSACSWATLPVCHRSGHKA